MNIRNQKWTEYPTFIQLKLHQPMWSAYQKYGWERGVEGLGISKEAINFAHTKGKRIRVVMGTYGKYEISPSKCKQAVDTYNSRFTARDGKELIVVPRTYFAKVTK